MDSAGGCGAGGCGENGLGGVFRLVWLACGHEAVSTRWAPVAFRAGRPGRRRPGLVVGRKDERYAAVACRPRSQSRRYSVKAEAFILPP